MSLGGWVKVSHPFLEGLVRDAFNQLSSPGQKEQSKMSLRDPRRVKKGSGEFVCSLEPGVLRMVVVMRRMLIVMTIASFIVCQIPD